MNDDREGSSAKDQPTDSTENKPAAQPETRSDPPAEPRGGKGDGGKKGNLAPRRSAGRGLAALLLILGLLIGLLFGGLVGLFTPRTGVLEGLPGTVEPSPVPTPVPTTVTRTVEVERLITPEACLDALDDLTAYVADLADVREALMRADLARVAGDEEAAGTGLADVDRRLRSLILSANARSLRSAVQSCQDQARPVATDLDGESGDEDAGDSQDGREARDEVSTPPASRTPSVQDADEAGASPAGPEPTPQSGPDEGQVDADGEVGG